jgi:hypothetical protein
MMRRSVTVETDADLFRRGAETLLASWEEYARGATAAAVERLPGVTTAVFAAAPERAVYNNALLERGLPAAERADAVDAMEAAYAAACVTHFAAWVHESDEAMRSDLEQRGYTLDTSTRAMGMALDEIRLLRPQIELPPRTGSSTCASSACRRISSRCRPQRLPDPGCTPRRRERRDCDGVRPRRRLRDLQRRNAGACPAARTRHRADGAPRARCSRARMSNGERPIDRDGRARLRRRRLPRSRPDP